MICPAIWLCTVTVAIGVTAPKPMSVIGMSPLLARVPTTGIGPAPVTLADRILRAIRNRVGDVPALPLLPFGLLALNLARLNPPVPYSLYVKAVKRNQT